MRKTVGVSVFPVGFSGGLKLEGPLCVNGNASKWHAAWDPNRSEFTFQLFQYYLDRSESTFQLQQLSIIEDNDNSIMITIVIIIKTGVHVYIN